MISQTRVRVDAMATLKKRLVAHRTHGVNFGKRTCSLDSWIDFQGSYLVSSFFSRDSNKEEKIICTRTNKSERFR